MERVAPGEPVVTLVRTPVQGFVQGFFLSTLARDFAGANNDNFLDNFAE